MLHHHVLIRLCNARDMLCQIEEEVLSIAFVAKEIGMSPYHFSRLFKAVFGVSPNQYQLKARLERAKILLLSTEFSVTQICMEVGFSSLGSFSTTFTKVMGLSPSAFRHTTRHLAREASEIPKEFIPSCFSLMAGIYQ